MFARPLIVDNTKALSTAHFSRQRSPSPQRHSDVVLGGITEFTEESTLNQ